MLLSYKKSTIKKLSLEILTRNSYYKNKLLILIELIELIKINKNDNCLKIKQLTTC